MNIIFIDYDNNFVNKKEKYMYNLLGLYIRKIEGKNIYYLSINPKYGSYKILNFILKKILRKKKIFAILSMNVDLDSNLNKNLSQFSSDITIITEQNNLIFNDKRYINKFLKEKNIDKRKVSILLIIDKLNDIIKNKVIDNINEYRTVDILVHGKSLYFDTKDFAEKINKEYGTTIETLDKMPQKNYNILLVFSKEDIEIPNKSSFILDYNNSDLDVESNVYKVYLKNKDEIDNIFLKLNMNISNYKKTKLGKLYIHKEWNTLDK